jgi:ubiquinol-cytochrome c reductase cytochrome b subunit
MGAIASLVVIIASGVVLSLNGPTWWHVSSFGHFVNSTHLWSVEFFFLFMVVHLWGKFWMASWRGGRLLTWITGVVAFAVSIGAAFTGYLLQTNFESEWIAFEAKDALNAAGIGAWFNVANAGQMFMWHITLLPLAVAAIVALHVLLVRVHGVVPPLDAADSDAQLTGEEVR